MPSGRLVVSEYHPVRRIWDDTKRGLEIRFNYFDLGPHQYDRAEDIPDAVPGSLPSYEYHWTISQYLMAVLNAGCELVAVEEFGDQPEAREQGPSLAGLPRCLLIVARRKEGPTTASSRRRGGRG